MAIAKKQGSILKLGSETEAEKGVYHLCKNGDKPGTYVAMLEPWTEWKGKKYRSRTITFIKKGSLGECRRAIGAEINTIPDKKTAKKAKKKSKDIARESKNGKKKYHL